MSEAQIQMQYTIKHCMHCMHLSPMAIKCMEFCQALTSQGVKFSFNLYTGTGFSFTLDTKESGKPTSVVAEPAKKRRKKKKLSPSDVRRNERRRQEFLKRKSEGAKCEGSVLQTPESQVADLQLTPVHQQRDEEDEMPSSLQSPPSTLPLVCDLPHSYSDRPCGQTFSSEDGLRVHADRWPLDLHSW